jgi:hypothetical protein
MCGAQGISADANLTAAIGGTPHRDVENEILITGLFLGAGLIAYVIIPGVLDAPGRKAGAREAFRLR